MELTEEQKIEEAKKRIQEGDSLLVGAGAGLSAAAGFQYSGKIFEDNFADFEKKYGFHDLYSGGFTAFESPEESWAYWSRMIMFCRYRNASFPVYDNLVKYLKNLNKDYFILTTNVDHCFQKAGADKERLFYTQGDYGLFQCSVPCHPQTYDNEEIIRKMVEEQKDMRVPSELIPHCPKCGAPMTMNLRSDEKFVEDDGWKAAAKRYDDFVLNHKNGKMVLLELGVGFNTPDIIKYPFWKLAYRNPDVTYLCVNSEDAEVPDEIERQSLLFQEDIGTFLKEMDIR